MPLRRNTVGQRLAIENGMRLTHTRARYTGVCMRVCVSVQNQASFGRPVPPILSPTQAARTTLPAVVDYNVNRSIDQSARTPLASLRFALARRPYDPFDASSVDRPLVGAAAVTDSLPRPTSSSTLAAFCTRPRRRQQQLQMRLCVFPTASRDCRC